MKKLLMSLLSIGMLSAVVSCSDDDNDTPTASVIKEDVSKYTSYQDFLDFRAKQTQITATQYNHGDCGFDLAIEGDENFDGTKFENFHVSFYTADHTQLYDESKTGYNGYGIEKNPLNGIATGTYNSPWIQDLPAAVPVDVEVTAYDKDTNTFYQGTLDNVTYPVNSVVVLKVNLTKKN